MLKANSSAMLRTDAGGAGAGSALPHTARVETGAGSTVARVVPRAGAGGAGAGSPVPRKVPLAGAGGAGAGASTVAGERSTSACGARACVWLLVLTCVSHTVVRRFADAWDTLEAAVRNRDGPLLAKLRAARDADFKDMSEVAAECVPDSLGLWLAFVTEAIDFGTWTIDQCHVGLWIPSAAKRRRGCGRRDVSL